MKGGTLTERGGAAVTLSEDSQEIPFTAAQRRGEQGGNETRDTELNIRVHRLGSTPTLQKEILGDVARTARCYYQYPSLLMDGGKAKALAEEKGRSTGVDYLGAFVLVFKYETPQSAFTMDRERTIQNEEVPVTWKSKLGPIFTTTLSLLFYPHGNSFF